MWLVLVGFLVCFAILQCLETARESEVKVQLEAIARAQRAYYLESKEYSDDYQRMGYFPEGQLREKVFFSKEKLPPEFRSNLPGEVSPFVGKDSFRILYVMKTGENLQFFSLDDKNIYKKIYLRYRP